MKNYEELWRMECVCSLHYKSQIKLLYVHCYLPSYEWWIWWRIMKNYEVWNACVAYTINLKVIQEEDQIIICTLLYLPSYEWWIWWRIIKNYEEWNACVAYTINLKVIQEKDQRPKMSIIGSRVRFPIPHARRKTPGAVLFPLFL